MSTHRRAWLVRAAVVMVAAAAGAVGLALPAAAASVDVQITSLNGSMNSGGTTQLQYSIKNTSPTDTSAHIAINFGGDLSGLVTCTGGQCNGITPIANDGTAHSFSATLTAGSVDPGQTRNGTVTVQVQIGTDNAQDSGPLSVSGGSAVQAVPQLSGLVVDLFKGDAGPIANAKVAAQDSAVPTPHTWEVGTDTKGAFKILSTPDKPIAPGTIVFIVTKDGYQQYKQIINNAAPGVPITNLRFAMTPAGSTASPSATLATPTGPPVSSIDTGQGAATSGGNQGSGGGLSWVLIGIGAVLVALGIAAIVILLVRRKGDDDEDDDNSGRGGRGPGGGRGAGPRPPHPPGGRRPEATAIMPGRPGRGPGGPGSRDQTMIARSPLADMPTQMHGRVPPGSPAGPPPGPGYGGPNPYGHQQPHGGHAGPPPNYGQPDPYATGYGQQGPGGYGQQQPGAYPGGYDPEHDQRGGRSGRQGDRRVDWLEE